MKNFTLFFLAGFLIISLPSLAQVTVSLGTYAGASSTNSLLSTSTSNNRYSRTISLYTASEINTAGGMTGIISKLAWDKHGTGEYTTADAYIKIYLKHVTNSTWDSSSVPDWNTEVVGATEVFTSSTYSIPTGTGWKEVPFTTPFIWNGLDNIAIFVEWDRSSALTTAISWGRSNLPNTNATRVGNVSLNALTFLINGSRPLVQLTIDSSNPDCDAPTNLMLDDVTFTTTDISWDASADEVGGYSWALMNSGDHPDTGTPVDSGTTATGITDVVITGLNQGTNYAFYVKTLCGTNRESFWAGPLAFSTETCEAPTNLFINDITATTVTITWTEPVVTGNIEDYGWRVMYAGDDPINDVPVAEGLVPVGTPIATITGLDQETHYDVYLVSVCDFATQLFSDHMMLPFATLKCEIPTHIMLDDVTDKTATFSWTDSVSQNEGYAWAVFLPGEDPEIDDPIVFGFVSPGVTTVTVIDLIPETEYDFYMVTMCDAVNEIISDIAGPVNFTTETLSTSNKKIEGFTFYPNPSSSTINISATTPIENVLIYNLMGQRVVEEYISSVTSQLDISALASGIYMMQVTSNGQTGTYKIIKE